MRNPMLAKPAHCWDWRRGHCRCSTNEKIRINALLLSASGNWPLDAAKNDEGSRQRTCCSLKSDLENEYDVHDVIGRGGGTQSVRIDNKRTSCRHVALTVAEAEVEAMKRFRFHLCFLCPFYYSSHILFYFTRLLLNAFDLLYGIK